MIAPQPAAAAPSAWDDALLAAAMIALDPVGLRGIHVRARAGPVRDRWLAQLDRQFDPGAPRRRIAAGISEARLSGGLDIGATLSLGRPAIEQGVLAAVHQGIVVLAMAERLAPSPAGVIAMALDDGHVRIERDGVSALQPAKFALVALDEGVAEDEALAPALADRLGLRVDLEAVGWREAATGAMTTDLAAAKRLLPGVAIPDEMIEALCAFAMSAGCRSMRAPVYLLRAARAAAALRGVSVASLQDAATALRLVLGLAPSVAPAELPDAQPEAPQEQEPAQPQEAASSPDQRPSEPSSEEQQPLSAEAMQDMLVQAVQATLPKHLLAATASAHGARGTPGKVGAAQERGTRGRAVGIVATPPVPAARIDVLSTLRRAAPWQCLRRDSTQGPDIQGGRPRLHIRKDDFRYVRRRDKTGTTAIFAVDASGSAAVERLAETKGAVELLLSECYVRRDSVALIAFRGKGAETLLEPTRSLVRAKRCLSALPGGGGTPLASGILAAFGMARAAMLKGQGVVTVFLTDGRGNIALDGSIEKSHVAAETVATARLFRAGGLRSILIDTAQRPQPRAEALAKELGAEYLALPRGGARRLSREIGARMEGKGDGPRA